MPPALPNQTAIVAKRPHHRSGYLPKLTRKSPRGPATGPSTLNTPQGAAVLRELQRQLGGAAASGAAGALIAAAVVPNESGPQSTPTEVITGDPPFEGGQTGEIYLVKYRYKISTSSGYKHPSSGGWSNWKTFNTGLFGTLRKSMFLWLNPTPEDDLDELIKHFNQVRTALDLMLDGKVSWNDYLEIAAACGVDIDSYLETSNDNLIVLA